MWNKNPSFRFDHRIGLSAPPRGQKMELHALKDFLFYYETPQYEEFNLEQFLQSRLYNPTYIFDLGLYKQELAYVQQIKKINKKKSIVLLWWCFFFLLFLFYRSQTVKKQFSQKGRKSQKPESSADEEDDEDDDDDDGEDTPKRQTQRRGATKVKR